MYNIQSTYKLSESTPEKINQNILHNIFLQTETPVTRTVGGRLSVTTETGSRNKKKVRELNLN